MQITFDRHKLAELMLYVAERCQFDPKFGYTKLHKILFFSDFIAFARLGKPITGAEYQKLQNGPAARQFLPAVSDLEHNRSAVVQHKPMVNFVQHRLIALREPDLTQFTASEISIVDEVIHTLRHANAKQVSGLSHAFLGWKAADLHETIPYATALVSKQPLSEADIEHGRALASRLTRGS